MKQMNNKKGLIVLIILVCIYLTITVVLNVPWKKLGVPGNGGFNDLRGALEFVEMVHSNQNPFTEMHGGFWHVYPKVWGVFYPLLQVKNCRTIGVIVTLLYFLTFLTFIKIRDYTDLLIYALIIVSPAFMLCVERGNVDLILFIIVGLSLFFYKRENIVAVAILLASFLKFFPIYGIVAYKNKITIIISAIIFILFLYLIRDQMHYISINLQRIKPYIGAYGITVLPDLLKAKLNVPILFTYIFQVICAIFFMFLVRPINLSDQKNDFTFLISAGIFAGSYLLGVCFVYKLIFILFAIPKLLDSAKIEKYYLFILVLIISSLWENFTVGMLTKITPTIGLIYRILNQIVLIYLLVFFIKPLYFKFIAQSKELVLLVKR
jgi:hypothetical protein